MKSRKIVNFETGRDYYIKAKEEVIIKSDDKMRNSWTDLVKLKNSKGEKFYIRNQQNKQNAPVTYTVISDDLARDLIKTAKNEGIEEFIKQATLSTVWKTDPAINAEPAAN